MHRRRASARSSWPRLPAASAARASQPEIGWHDVEMTADAADDPRRLGLPPRFEAFQWHSYAAIAAAGSGDARDQPRLPSRPTAIGDRIWGIQFHAEVAEPTRSLDPATTGQRPGRGSRSGIDPDAMLGRDRAARSAPGTSSGAGSALAAQLC